MEQGDQGGQPDQRAQNGEGGESRLNSQHKAIRALLTTMSPNRATDYIKSFNLRPDEENFLIETDVYGKSLVETAIDYNVCPETIRNKRKSAYAKISDEINNIPHAIV